MEICIPKSHVPWWSPVYAPWRESLAPPCLSPSLSTTLWGITLWLRPSRDGRRRGGVVMGGPRQPVPLSGGTWRAPKVISVGQKKKPRAAAQVGVWLPNSPEEPIQTGWIRTSQSRLRIMKYTPINGLKISFSWSVEALDWKDMHVCKHFGGACKILLIAKCIFVLSVDSIFI